MNKTIKIVELEGKEIIYNQSSILNHVKEYYERLYTSINYGITNIALKEIIICEIPKLESNDSTSLDKDISEREVEVLKNMKNIKLTGSDDLTIDFKKNLENF